MKHFIKIIYSIAVFTALLFAFNSCRKDDNDNNPGASSSTIISTITGRVVDESDVALSGVTVTAYGKTAITDQNGIFLFKNSSVNKERCVLQFTKAGFFNRAHAFSATANSVNYVKIVLMSNAQTHTLSATTGGTITLANNASVQFQSNSFVTAAGAAYSGSVSIAFKHLSPASATFGFSIPGGDLAGTNAAGDDVNLYSYGMFGVELTGSGGQPLQLATGKTATLSMPVAATQMATAPATIPLWYFDETTSLWLEEGQALLVGNKYVGTVSHFTWWNCDVPGSRAAINGKVVDCNGIPIPNVNVTLDGWFVMTTDQNGEYTDWVPSGMAFVIQVLSLNNSGAILNSQIENIPALSPNQTFIVPPLVVTCPSRVAGTIKSCAGNVTTGFASLSNASGFFSYQYTVNGVFNLVAKPNTALQFIGSNNETSITQSINSLASPNVLDIGNILMCDTIDGELNSFTIMGGPFSNQLFTLSDTAFAHIGTVAPLLYVEAFDLYYPNYYTRVQISYPDTVPGTYIVQDSSGVFIDIFDLTDNILYLNSGGIINLTQVGNIGGRVKGSYSGNATLYSFGNGATSNVQISGNFNVLRTQ